MFGSDPACANVARAATALLCGVLASDAFAQPAPAPLRFRHLDDAREAGMLVPDPPAITGPIGRTDLPGGDPRPKVMLTGFWPPTNEMLRRFSPDPIKNPDGWIGSDWEGRGYDVVSFFPEFEPPDCSSCGPGMGELMVDYQDTFADFFDIANAMRPIAVVTFSRGAIDLSWEVEMNQYNRAVWIDDFIDPRQPTPAPPDPTVPAETLRLSTQPVQEIVDAIADANLGLDPFICFAGHGGGYVSEFVAYLGAWYQAMHASPADPDWTLTGGHVHVGGLIDWTTARLAAETTVRTVMDYVDCTVFPDSCSTSTTSMTSTSSTTSTTDTTSTTVTTVPTAVPTSTTSTTLPFGTCSLVPIEGCTRAGSARLALKAKRSSLDLSWRRTTAHTDDFGALSRDDGFLLCVYDHAAGEPRVVVQANVPPGAEWSASRRAVRFRSKSGMPDGIRFVVLKPGTATARIGVRGHTLALPSLPLVQDPLVRAQLVSRTGTCWDARFGAPAAKNDARRYRASGS